MTFVRSLTLSRRDSEPFAKFRIAVKKLTSNHTFARKKIINISVKKKSIPLDG